MEITDQQIDDLIRLPKLVINPNLKMKLQRSSLQVTYDLRELEGEREFKLYLRQNPKDPESYSCGLIYVAESPDQSVTLCRYNGSSHVHCNSLEDDEPIHFKCHIHRASERYIALGDKAEKYAETTDRYTSYEGALICILEDCNISGLDVQREGPVSGEQMPLW